MADLNRIKNNVSKMVSMGAPEGDIDSYIQEEGTTIDAIRNFNLSSKSDYTYGQAVIDTAKIIGRSAGNLAKNLTQPVLHPIQTAQGIASAATHPIETGKAIGGFVSERYGNLDRLANTVSTDPFGFVGDVAGAGAMASGAGQLSRIGNIQRATSLAKTGEAISGGVKNTSELAQKAWVAAKGLKPKIYNDEFVTNSVKSAIAKVQSKIQPLRDMYKQINEPFANQIVDNEIFQKSLNVIPKSIRNDFLEEYGTKFLDVNGKQQTTIGNLQRMELELKDFIQQPQFGQKINAADYNVAEAAKKMKDIRLSQLPQEAQNAIKILDKKFGPAIQASNELLPKLADKNGVPNTKFLFTTFKDPSRAGMRDYLKNLNSIGIDLMPEIKNVRGWVARQGMKSFVKGNIGKVVEGAVIGGVLKVGH